MRITEESIVLTNDWRSALPRSAYSKLEVVKSAQTWFEVYRVTPDVYALYEPGQFEEVISYLVLGSQSAALVDTGLGIGNVRRLAEEITRLPITVVNTHSHYDHVAQNYLFNNVAIFDASNARRVSENGYSKAEMAWLLTDTMLAKPLPKDFDSEQYHVPPFKVTRWLNDGAVVDLGNRKLEVFHTPGHSPDSICLLDRKARLLWTGDTYYPAPIYLHFPESSLDTFIRSYERMIALLPHCDVLLPSHNETCVEKMELTKVLEAAREIKAGRGRFVEGIEMGIRIRKYEFQTFAIITKAE